MFANTLLLQTVDIPTSVTLIERRAFYAAGLVVLHIPTSVSVIEAEAFYSAALVVLDIPTSVTVIEAKAFHYCVYLNCVSMANLSAVSYPGPPVSGGMNYDNSSIFFFTNFTLFTDQPCPARFIPF
jgi:hypothetical protein